MMADAATLTVEQIGFVRRLTLNRPGQHNPLTPRAVREILQAVAAAEGDEHVRVVVIRSTGRSFSSGYGFVAEDVEPGDFVPHAAIEGDVTAMLDLASGWAKVWDCAYSGHRPGTRGTVSGRWYRSGTALRSGDCR